MRTTHAALEQHPELLLERERTGQEIGIDEQATLAEHCRHCGVCRLERLTAPQLDLELQVRDGDEAMLAGLAAAAMAAAPLAAPGASSGSKVTSGSWGTVGLAALLVAAGALLLWWFPPTSTPPRFDPARVGVARARSQGPAGPGVRAISVPMFDSVATIASPPDEAIASPPSPEAGRTAGELLAAANRARRAGDLARAKRLYEELARQHRGAREEILARATRGRLLLDQGGQAKRALRLFDSYLEASPGGTLAEEATAGRAQALRQLGREQQEAKAWRRLVEQYPQSLHRALAEKRLATLEP